jgi:membrane associated rhomboid family serine protease
MIPIRDQNPTHRFPIVTVSLIVINVIVFLFELSLESQGRLMSFFDSWAVIPVQLVTTPVPEAPSVFSAMFLHGGWSHLLGNMLYLWIFGDNIEDALGPVRFLIFYLLAGIFATLAQVLIDPSSPIPNIGASGAIAGVLGGYLMLYPRIQVITLIPLIYFYRLARIPAVFVLGFWFVLQLFNGVLGLGNIQMEGGGVAFFAHIGGFVAGYLLIRLFMGRRQTPNVTWGR